MTVGMKGRDEVIQNAARRYLAAFPLSVTDCCNEEDCSIYLQSILYHELAR
jgi:hypothetical protein